MNRAQEQSVRSYRMHFVIYLYYIVMQWRPAHRGARGAAPPLPTLKIKKTCPCIITLSRLGAVLQVQQKSTVAIFKLCRRNIISANQHRRI